MDEHAVIVVDTAGVVRQWNAVAERLFGYSSDEAVGRPVDLVIPGQWREAHWSGFERAMRAPELRDMAADLPVLCADGNTRHFPGRLLVLYDALGKAVGAMAIFTPTGSTGRRPFD